MANWNPVAVKAQLRVTTQRLAQLQEKKDSQGQITRRDIATLLQQGNVELARTKAQNLLQEDMLGDLLEILEMHVGLILEHFNEIDQSTAPSPMVVEAASSIIFASPHVDSRDLNIVRDILILRFGPDFARSAINNHDGHVGLRVIRALSAPPPTAAQLDHQLANIAATYSVEWMPHLDRKDILNDLSELLDAGGSPTLDLPRLRKLCAQGLPDDYPWLRPRIWKIFFGILSTTKTSWKSEMQSQRESYYNLVRRLLGPFSAMPPPTIPLDSRDATLLDASKQLNRVSPSLLTSLQEEPEISDLCPLDERAPDDIRIDCATDLDSRLRAILERDAKNSSNGVPPILTPEIRIEIDDNGPPDIALSSPESPDKRHASTTLLHSKTYHFANAHQKHFSALLRLLYLHSSINPAISSPHISSLLVPLYSVLLCEVEPQELAHAEADTFWLFESMIGEISELQDEEGTNLWMRRFGERVAWADEELCTDLHAKGLEPALPHYSYRWLSLLLTQTISPPSVFVVWDAMFSRPMRDRESNPRLDYLLDFCTAMLIRAKPALFRLGKPMRRRYGLWSDDNDDGLHPSSLPASEIGDAFLEGMSLLQQYSVQSAGGVDRLLQTASDLSHRRNEESKVQKGENQGLGALLKATMWRGLARIPSPESPVEAEEGEESNSDGHVPDDGSETETQQMSSPSRITSRLAQVVWKGITNQTAMEPPPTPATPLSASSPSYTSPPTTPSALASDMDDNSPRSSISSRGSTSIWSYAEKLKDSDTVASLAKVSTNWRAKAMLGGWSVGSGPIKFLRERPTTSEAEPAPHAGLNSFDLGSQSNVDGARHPSPPNTSRGDTYTPPERPAYFRPPRDSMLPQPRRSPLSSPSSPEMSPRSETSLLSKAHHIRALASLSLSSNPPPEPKTVPRPLLLNSASLITPTTPGRSSPSPSSASRNNPPFERDQWAAVIRAKGQSVHKGSQSASSFSTSDAWGRSPRHESRSDRDSDGGPPSRMIPLNRKSISPMAAGIRTPAGRPTSPASSATSSERGLMSPTAVIRDTIGSSNIPIPASIKPLESDYEHRRLTVSTEPNPLPNSPVRKSPRKKAVPALESEADDTSDSSLIQASSKGARTRPARRNPQNLNLRMRDNPRFEKPPEQKTISPNTLAPEYPQDIDIATTPKASSFDHSPTLGPRSPRRTRKYSGEDMESRARKSAADGSDVWMKKITTDVPPRTRKISGEGRTRDSAAIEGDDEGYDDLLSAYESEESYTAMAY